MRQTISFAVLLGLFFMAASPLVVLAQTDQPVVSGLASTAGFLLLLPLGLILLNSSALPLAEHEAVRTATAAMVVWAVAVLAYFWVGFAFQFGGVAVNNPHPDFAELYWNWSPLNASFGTGWGVIGLRGWALLGSAATPGVYDLFLRHVALLGVVVTIPSFILHRRLNTLGMVLFGLLGGTLLYPLVGNWVWSGGWLASLGATQGLGHGFVDAGIATPFALTGIISLAALVVFRPKIEMAETVPATAAPTTERPDSTAVEAVVPMPAVYWPLFGFLGLILVLWSWAFIAGGAHIPTATAFPVDRTALNGILSAITAGLVAALYSRFTTTEFNPLMVIRGTVAGLVAVSTAAPFIPPWQALLVGGLVGLTTPLLIYLVDHWLKLADHTASIATFTFIGLIAWLLPGLLADGSSGAGWNNIGSTSYLEVEGQGVSGLAVAARYVSDWPDQFNAQVLGGAAIFGWAFLLSLIYFSGYRWLSSLRRQDMVGSAVEEQVAAAADFSRTEDLSQTEKVEPVALNDETVETLDAVDNSAGVTVISSEEVSERSDQSSTDS